MNKRAALGDYLDLVYRLAIIGITVIIIFGTYTFAFAPSVDVGDSEAIILQKKLYNCFNPGGHFNLTYFKEADNKIFEKCGINLSKEDEGRYYLKIVYLDGNGNVKNGIGYGDSGTVWVEDLANSNRQNTGKNFWDNYSPGFSNKTYSIIEQGRIEQLNIEVWINEI